MFKVGDEVYVKATVVDTDKHTFENYNHKVQFADSINCEWDWVSESSISDKTYTQGFADAWELVKKIVLDKDRGGFSCSELESIFDTVYPSDILEKLSFEEALAKIEAYEKEKEIKVGDEVKYGNTVGVVTCVTFDMVSVMWKDGSTGDNWKPKDLTKTGKHIDIESLLKQIGE